MKARVVGSSCMASSRIFLGSGLAGMAFSPSGNQDCIQIFHYGRQVRTKQLVHLAQPTFLGKWRVFEVVRLDTKIGGDVVADHFEPLVLFFCETFAPPPPPPPPRGGGGRVVGGGAPPPVGGGAGGGGGGGGVGWGGG